jgi:hypothetical protein
MTQPISDYMVGDSYAHSIPKPSLQQYDNYQIYSIACIGDTLDKLLAFQVYDITLIPVDFTQICIKYS